MARRSKRQKAFPWHPGVIFIGMRRPYPGHNGDGWLFKPKWDGWRCIAVVEDGRARLLSRRGNDITARFPAVAEALGYLSDGTVLDAEIVVLAPDFARCVARARRRS